MIRIYIVPIVIGTDGLYRIPKYFPHRFATPPIVTVSHWSMKDYGSINVGIVCTDIDQANHDWLAAQPDVYSFPENIDVNMPQGEQSNLITYLEGALVPAQWLAGTMTYRAVLRTITGMFLYQQRFLAILGYPTDPFAGLTLNTQFRNLPTAYQDAATQAAADLDFDFSGIRQNTTVRVLLKSMADQWGASPIYFGDIVL